MVILIFSFIAGFLRTLFIMKPDCWFDCSFSVLITQKPLDYILSGVDVHPPLYYIILKIWYYIFGNSIMAGRLLSVAISVIFLFTLYYITKRLYGEKIGIITLVLASVATTYIIYSIEIRMYMLVCLLILLTYYFFVTQRYRLFTIFFVLSIYTHYYSAFFGLFVAYKFFFDKDNQKAILKSTIISFILTIPLFFYFWHQTMRLEKMWLKLAQIESLPSAFFHQFAVPSNSGNVANAVTIYPYIFLVIVYGLIFWKAKWNENKELYLLGFGIPLIIFFGAMIVHIPYHHRFLLMYAFPLYILLAIALEHFVDFDNFRYIPTLLIMILGFQIYFYVDYFQNANTQLQDIGKYLDENHICPANILHESPFSLVPAMVYNPRCNHYLITNLTEKQGNSAGFDVIPKQNINANVSYDYYYQSQFGYANGSVILKLNGIRLIKVGEKNGIS